MADDRSPRRPRAETPKGFRDYFGADVAERKAMLDAIARVYERHGFDPLETSAVETVEALGKFLPDVDRPNEGVFAWQDEDKDWLALRYDLTAPLARVAAQFRNDLPSPYRRYAMGPVWRNEKPGPGRFRQFYQCDADTVGTPTVAADAEICAMLADALEEVGIERGDYIVRVNNRKVLNGVMEVAGVLDPSDPEKFVHERGIVLRAIDKIDRLGDAGVRALLGDGRKDESGDFTKGAGLAPDQAEVVMGFMAAKRDTGAATVARLRELVGASIIGTEGVDELEQIASLLAAQGYGPDRIVIDPSVVRGLGYYTGPVFEAELTFTILDDKGRPRQFGSVAGGGRYDDLVKRFTGQSVPATGVSIGVDRLLAALRAKGRAGAAAQGPVVVTVMDRDRMADYMAMAAELRRAGIRAEVYLGNPKNFGNQLKYADKRASPVAVIQGSARGRKGHRHPQGSDPRREDRGRGEPRGMEVQAGTTGSAARQSRERRNVDARAGMMPDRAAIRAEADRLYTALQATGAHPVEADILLPAGTLLDLYGEDIRARAYVTQDPIRGEMMLRPDFTVPVVQMHMTHGAEPARYCYRGEVFRKQDHVEARASEYLQVGYEVFARDNPPHADAEVFALFSRLLAPLNLRPATGDMGLIFSAVRGLETSDRRKAALLRHVWRPARFRGLLDRFTGRMPASPARLGLLARLRSDAPEALIEAAGQFIGLRDASEIAARATALVEDAATPPIPDGQAVLLDTLFSLSGPAPQALNRLRTLAVELPSIAPAVERFAARLDALANHGIDPATLPFEASHGRNTLEYYDGFVFSFHAADPALPPVASGGRYDALTAVLGLGRSIPAVGGVIRPGLTARLGATT